MLPTKSCLVRRNSFDHSEPDDIDELPGRADSITVDFPTVSFTDEIVQCDDNTTTPVKFYQVYCESGESSSSSLSESTPKPSGRRNHNQSCGSRSHSPSFLPSALKHTGHHSSRSVYDTSGFVSGSSTSTYPNSNFSFLESSATMSSIVRSRTSASVGHKKRVFYSQSHSPSRRASAGCLCNNNFPPITTLTGGDFMTLESTRINHSGCCSDVLMNMKNENDSCCSPSHSFASLPLDGTIVGEPIHDTTSYRHSGRQCTNHYSSNETDRLRQLSFDPSLDPTESFPSSPDSLTLIVDNRRFFINIRQIQAKPNTLLGRLFAKTNPLDTEDVELPYDFVRGVSADVFHSILEYYTKDQMTCPSHLALSDFKQICRLFQIPFDHHSVHFPNLRTFLHEIANDGAKDIFERFLEDDLLPEMMKSAYVGERECHIVVLLNDDILDWDLKNPPPFPENEIHSQILYSTAMNRFLKYVENREVAKLVLMERGLKKIRIGIEGFPTHKEKIKMRAGHRREVIYSFVQRPFLRMSWEEEENRSRHVDFQFVKSKSNNDVSSLGEVAESITVDLPPSLLSSTRIWFAHQQ